jgi:putative MATE family efflux protein
MSELFEAAAEPRGARGAPVSLPPPAQMRQEIWALSWPVILSFGLDSILGLASILMVGRLGADAVGAVGLGTQVLGAVRAGIGAIGTGTVALVARDVGGGDHDHAELVLTQSVVFGVIISALIAVPVIIFAPQALALFHVEGPMADLGTRYLRVVMLSEPFTGVFLMCASALRGAGDTRTPLWIGGLVDVIAIFLNYVLIFGKFGAPALGVDGCAIASLIALSLGGALFFWALSMPGSVLHFRWRQIMPDFALAWRILKVGYPAAIEQLVIQFGFFAYVRFVASYGDKPVAAYFIGVRILALSFLPGFGFSAAAATLVGQGLGAGDKAFSRRAGWQTTYMAIAMMSALGVVVYLFAAEIAQLFIDDPAVIAYTITFMYALGAAQPLMAVDWTLTGALRGAGDTQFPLFASVAGFYGLRLALTILIVYYRGPVSWVWWSLIADYMLRSSLKTARFRSRHWENVKV